mmetsp:Transcript_35270/g.77050  ORF Transcript_35270/g.77050 Transcript_35270/m.77050 type:complete len:247 (+) Transcript_35270:134-874(+)
MLKTIFPVAFVAFPSPSGPLHLSKAFSPIGHKLTVVLHAIAPLHAALPRHAVLCEAALVYRTISSQQLANAVRAVAFKLTAVLGSLGPRHYAVSMAKTLQVLANEVRAVWGEFFTFSVSLIVNPLRLVRRAVRQDQSASAVAKETLELSSVGRAIRIGGDASAILWPSLVWCRRSSRCHHPAVLCLQQIEDAETQGASMRCRRQEEGEGPVRGLEDHGLFAEVFGNVQPFVPLHHIQVKRLEFGTG